ncbi:hypothetical protein G9F72_022600 [Clostridium estertheticum]|uniref:hypothetical protein n=1 Tax=Clostridium estertheticum TaxID=238834 RepID=UPI0013E90565|nr:hypothetical protein [Clostridium estertheticum]MBZ9689092.1 hypothetical protein [Clostridium estertheticum]
MEQYRNILNKKLTLMTVFTVLAATFIVLTGVFVNKSASINEDISDMIHGFQVGIFIGLQVTMIIYIAKYRKALKNENELKKLYIKEHDERIRLINDKISGVGFNFCLVAITTAIITAGFFSQIIFLTLLGVLTFMCLVKGSLKIYYRNKF